MFLKEREMDCIGCTSKDCKLSARDCPGTRDSIVEQYQTPSTRDIYTHADSLVSGGKAGTLSRVEEILEFAKSQSYKNIGIAYCYSMEKEAVTLHQILKAQGFRTYSYRCTINGITEGEMCPGLQGGVNCNPIGQAEAVNAEGAELVIEMGLCLGHDILFHQHLKKPFTVLAVKDRVHQHNPLLGLNKDV